MVELWKRIEGFAVARPLSPVFADVVGVAPMTWGELLPAVERIAGYFASLGLRPGDFALVLTPRDRRAALAALGAWWAGIAVLLCDVDQPAIRFERIRRAVGAARTVSVAADWERMIAAEPTALVASDDDVPAFGIATSGSTGDPKIVIHGFGTIDLMWKSCEIPALDLWPVGGRFASFPPIGTVAFLICLVNQLAHGLSLHVIPSAIATDALLMKSYFIASRITSAFLPPSLARCHADLGPEFDLLVLSSEPCHNYRRNAPRIMNMYASSESGCAIATRMLDGQACDENSAGFPTSAVSVAVENGEIVIWQPWFLGYAPLLGRRPRDGRFATGDLGRFNAAGELIVCGRTDDLVKVNGVRIDLGEIECAFRAVFPCEWATARACSDGRHRLVVVYWQRSPGTVFDERTVRLDLSERLPSSFVPARFVELDSPPLLPSGKLDRLALPDPFGCRDCHEEPADAAEAALCAVFASVLALESVGANENVFDLGLDSVGAIESAMRCGLEGFDARIVFAERTPRRIAARYRAECEARGFRNRDDLDEQARSRTWPLTAYQRTIWQYANGRVGSTADNISVLIRFQPHEVAATALAAAVEKVLHHHPACNTVLEQTDCGSVVQRLLPAAADPIPVERLSEAQLDDEKARLVQPFDLLGHTLRRARVFETETAVYLFLEVHHLLMDGSSVKLLFSDIVRVLAGGAMPPDRYYLFLAESLDLVESDEWQRTKRWFDERYGSIRDRLPRIDRESKENRCVEMFVPAETSHAVLKLRRRPVFSSETELSIAAGLVALSSWNQADEVVVSWTFHGRTTAEKQSMAGLLISDLPVSARFHEGLTLGAFASDIRNQMLAGEERSYCPWTTLESGSWPSPWQRDFLEILCLGELYSSGSGCLKLDLVELPQGHDGMDNCLQVEVHGGCRASGFLFCYLSSVYTEASRRCFAAVYAEAFRWLADNGDRPSVTLDGVFRKLEGLS